jgi:hypothetical protein
MSKRDCAVMAAPRVFPGLDGWIRHLRSSSYFAPAAGSNCTIWLLEILYLGANEAERITCFLVYPIIPKSNYNKNQKCNSQNNSNSSNAFEIF